MMEHGLTSIRRFLARLFRREETVGGYRLLALLGKGAFGEVYVAQHSATGQRAAVKLIRPELCADPEIQARFEREAQALFALTMHGHPNIVAVHATGTETNGVRYLAMELVEGETLRKVLARAGVFPPERALRICRQIASGLATTHRVGVLHRDLKPENLLVTHADSPFEQVKVVDFGIVRPLQLVPVDEAQAPRLTVDGALIGTPYYLSPEQWLSLPLDGRSDIYSLGIILYELLTRRFPYPLPDPGASRGNLPALMMAHLSLQPLPLTHWDPLIPSAVDELVRDLLNRDPAGRPASMGEVVERLDQCLLQFPDGAGREQLRAGSDRGPEPSARSPRPPGMPAAEQPRLKPARIRLLVWGGGVAGLLLLALLILPRLSGWEPGSVRVARIEPKSEIPDAALPMAPSWLAEEPHSSAELFELRAILPGSVDDPQLVDAARQAVAQQVYARLFTQLGPGRPEQLPPADWPAVALWPRLMLDLSLSGAPAVTLHAGQLDPGQTGVALRLILTSQQWQALLQRYQTQWTIDSVGLQIARPQPTWNEWNILILNVKPSQPAQRAGLQPGDLVQAASPEALVRQLTHLSPAGAELTIYRPGTGPLVRVVRSLRKGTGGRVGTAARPGTSSADGDFWQ